jgi:hypothetical protein
VKAIWGILSMIAGIVLAATLPHSGWGNFGAVVGCFMFGLGGAEALYQLIVWNDEKEKAKHVDLPEDWDDWNVGDQQWYIHNMNLAGFDFEGTAKELPQDDEPMLLSKQEIRDALGCKPPIMFHDNALMQSRYAEDWYRARDKELKAKGYTVIESPPNVILPTSWTNQQENKPITRPMPPKGGGGVGNIYADTGKPFPFKVAMEDPPTDYSWIKFEKSSGT